MVPPFDVNDFIHIFPALVRFILALELPKRFIVSNIREALEGGDKFNAIPYEPFLHAVIVVIVPYSNNVLGRYRPYPA